ncbi:hypothetical protein [Bacillus thuringiensis]|uniref:hypothetical protein n=1 Tax=Bacillus thuringiensis TaxID=1428 RepID=UPI000BFA5388|nr:hypothetical protein [Bacillus thuringiensis]PET17066.1 hypothetical protein CN517_21285 [Bacillus thuringiensis]
MQMQTKLIQCDRTIYVFDYNRRKKIEEFRFEQKQNRYGLLDLKRLLLSNFDSEYIPTMFTLKSTLTDHTQLKANLHAFIQSVSKFSTHNIIKYLAILELPVKQNSDTIYIHCITDANIGYIGNLVDINTSMFEEEYLSKLWGNDVSIDAYNIKELLDELATIYLNSIHSQIFNNIGNPIITNRLNKPIIKWNRFAENYIRSLDLMNQTITYSDEFYDNKAGLVRITEYYLETSN